MFGVEGLYSEGGCLQEMTQKWGIQTAGEAQALSIRTLVSTFGERQGNYVWNAVRGIQADKGVHLSSSRKIRIILRTVTVIFLDSNLLSSQ